MHCAKVCTMRISAETWSRCLRAACPFEWLESMGGSRAEISGSPASRRGGENIHKSRSVTLQELAHARSLGSEGIQPAFPLASKGSSNSKLLKTISTDLKDLLTKPSKPSTRSSDRWG